MFKNSTRRYKYLVLGHEESYFVKKHSDSKHKYSEDDIIKMLEFLVDSIFVVFAGKVFQQIVGFPMGTNCAPLLADIFLYSYEAEFIQSLLSTGRKQLASRFNFAYRYIDDVSFISNPEFENYLGQMYPVELEIKDTHRATLLLLTWIYFCRSGGTVNFTLPFMTNVTISISTSQIFRSWVAIFQPRPPARAPFSKPRPRLSFSLEKAMLSLPPPPAVPALQPLLSFPPPLLCVFPLAPCRACLCIWLLSTV